MTRGITRIAAVIGALAITGTVLVAPAGPSPASAAPALPAASSAATASSVTAANWNPGNIISDALFYDAYAMTEAEIQAFLNSSLAGCTSSLCIKNLRVNVESRAAYHSVDTGRLVCKAFEGGYLSAAAIIYRAQQACSISAKVILVTLQKEQGLISNKSPSQTAVDRAMGMACPDTAPCAIYALGFGNQVYLGARQLMTYKAGGFSKQPGVQYIQYHPNAACGGTTFNVQNYATAALYAYTPYQPNAAALANMNGTGDSCSSYGNRNFWRFYNSWFGSTQGYPTVSVDYGPTIVALDGQSTLRLYRGNAAGGWAGTTTLSTSMTGITSVFGAGDFDLDGRRDLLAVDAAKVLWMYPFDAEGALGDRRKVVDDWNADLAFSPGDFNGDGYPDVISRDADGGLWLWPGNGRGKLQPPTQIGWGWGSMTSVLSPGDFSGDGNPDLIARDAVGNLWLYLGNGRNAVSSGRTIGWGWGDMTAITSPGDFTGDGRPDLLARHTNGTMYLYRGDGRGNFAGGGEVGWGWSDMVSISGPGSKAGELYRHPAGAGDLNGDGARDVLARTTDGTLLMYAGNGRSGWLGSSTAATGWGDVTMIMGANDFDGNGTSDVLARDSSGRLWLYSSDGTGTLGERRAAGNGWNEFDVMFMVGDFNGDRNNDMIARDAAGDLWLYPGDGAGDWLTPYRVGWGWGGMTSIVPVGDFDGDGNPDAVARTADGGLILYSGNGNGGWLPARQIGWGWGQMVDIFSPGDFTGDRLPDVLARSADGGLWLYPGNGRGGFLSGRQIGWGWESMSWLG